MNRTNSKAPVPAIATPERARQIEFFWKGIQQVQDIWGLKIAGDGLEIHDARVPGTYPAIVTESGELELLTAENFEWPAPEAPPGFTQSGQIQ